MTIQTAFTLFRVGAAVLEGKSKRAIALEQQKAENALRRESDQTVNARNFAEAAKADLALFVQSLENRRTANAAGRREAAARAAIVAEADAGTARTFEARIAASERAGALAAESSMAGVTGGATDIIASTFNLQRARQEFANRRQAEARAGAIAVGGADTAASGITGLDNRTLFATIDRSVTPLVGRGFQGNFATDALGAASVQDFVALGEDIMQGTNALANLFRPASTTTVGTLAPGAGGGSSASNVGMGV